MAASDASPVSFHNEDEKTNLSLVLDKYKDKVSNLPKEKGWMGETLYKYQGFWYRSQNVYSVETTMAMQDTFKAHPTDIYLVTTPKAGTTWIKALMFATVNRTKYNINNNSNNNNNNNSTTHPLLISNPHDCVPFIEPEFINKTETYLNLNVNPPRLFSTHVSYASLPRSILDDGCRLVYLCRNPKDVMVSWYYFSNKFTQKNLTPMTIEEMFEVFTKGMFPYGPYWDHVKEYYNASCQHPKKILFLTYEVMKKDTVNQVKRLAEFLGCGFTKEEEEKGVVEEIMRLCSLDVLKKVNKDGDFSEGVPNAVFFREGEVGGWRENLTAEMSRILDDITNEKFEGMDISF